MKQIKQHCRSILLLAQELMNVMYFYDDEAGTWLPLPLTWERHIPTVSKMVDEIKVH